MKKIFFIALFVGSIFTLGACDNEESNDTPKLNQITLKINDNEIKQCLSSPDYIEAINTLDDFYIRCINSFDENPDIFLSVCENNDYDSFYSLLGYSNIDVVAENFSNNILNLQKTFTIFSNAENYNCGCVSSGLMSIYNLVSSGGIVIGNNNHVVVGIDDPEGLVRCVALCSSTCLPMFFYSPAYIACVAACSAMCYNA